MLPLVVLSDTNLQRLHRIMIRKLFRFIIKLLLYFVAFSFLWVLAYRWLPVPYTPLMAIRYFESDNTITPTHRWVPIENISPNLQLAVICSEDQNFLKHNGFDFKAIKKAYASNKQGKKLRGGSTISQQTAKNAFLWPQRSWFRKGLEGYFTFLVELLWDKERILEVYLNSVEMGPGIYGAEAASRYWFGISASQLNRYQAASLAVVLPSPLKYSALKKTAYLENRRTWVIQQMRYYGTFTLKTQRDESASD